jgi:hypothetical protein
MHEKPELFDEHPAAEYIGMSVHFLRAGRLHGVVGNRTPPPAYYRIGRSIKYSRADLDAWLAERRVARAAKERAA